jgi:tight adherence protein B
VIRLKLNRKASAQWPEALELLIGAFRSGLNVEGALSVFYEEAPEPLRAGLRRRTAMVWKELPVERKIDILFADPEVNLVRAALRLSLENGGRPADLLASVARMLRGRREFEERVKSATAHARVTAWVVAFSPFLLGGAVGILAPEMVTPLFSSAEGTRILTVAGALIIVGLWSVQKMADLKS